ncbi:TPA: biotin--[acetyl-CoA-carboxylase] ligase [Candidatus Poribacteria bacterium]|nr:biotin--[acetyl-CoA-carboxylase] ligase [Candidatus Poribacteria bacterium]
MMTADDITSGLKTRSFGHRVYAYQQTRSTNEIALRLGANGAPNGALVIAEYQTAGKGRLGRSWISPPSRCILASLLLRPTIQPYQTPVVTLLAAAAAANSIRDLTRLPAKIKWPNDVIIAGKKVCGILTEMGTGKSGQQFLAVGIGINVNIGKDSFPISLKSKATSLSILLGYELPRIRLLQQFLLEFENRYILLNRGNLAPIISEVKSLSSILGRQVRIESDEKAIVGQAVDIDENGALVLRLSIGTFEKVITGSVTLI